MTDLEWDQLPNLRMLSEMPTSGDELDEYIYNQLIEASKFSKVERSTIKSSARDDDDSRQDESPEEVWPFNPWLSESEEASIDSESISGDPEV